MNKKRIFPFAAVAIAIITNIIGNSGCANIVPPGGGPRDSLPPQLVSASPKDSALNVTQQKIILNFDEFVELRNANEKLLITPYPSKAPLIESKLRSVTVRLKDSLLPNTTYVIDFGDAIVDLNESNQLKNFRYVFSTGPVIDSNELEGNIVIAETGTTDSTLFALLYTQQQDSTVVKEKPKYVARVDGAGKFKFTNLPAGVFYIYALGDADGNKQYSQLTETFAFLDSPVVVSTKSKPVQLFAFAAEKEKRRAASGSALPKSEIKSLIYSTNLENNTQDLLDSFKLGYQKPIRSVDSTKIVLMEDTTKPVSNFKVLNDTINKKLVLYTSWKPGVSYTLYLNSGYAKDTSGLTSIKNDTLFFRAREEKEYGSVRLRFKNLDLSRHPVLLIYSNKELKGSYPLQSAEWYRQLYKPGSYELGILYDENQNGRWDAGDYFSKPRRQPEKVVQLKAAITLKSNWDNETNIDVKQ